MVNINLCVGAAGFALGLSLAGLGAAGVASADSPKTDAARADSKAMSAGPERQAPTATKRMAVRAGNIPAKLSGRTAPGAPARRAGSIPLPSALDGKSDPPAAPIGNLGADTALAAPPTAAAPTAQPMDVLDLAAVSTANTPAITIHNSSKTESIWVYNLTKTADYSIPETPWETEPPPLPPDWVGPVEIKPGLSAPVTLAVFNAPPKSPGNRIYVVEGSAFTLPITPTSGTDPFDPTAFPVGDTFQNYSFLEYSLYPADGGYEYTIDVSYIDEWSLPIQTKFTINGADWNGAKSGKTYGFNDFDTVVNQLKAAGGPYSDLVWSGATPFPPQPPDTVHRIVGPDKVWTAQSLELPPNFLLDKSGWIPASYSDFVKYGAYMASNQQMVYPYAYNGTVLTKPPVSPNPQDPNAQVNFDFWLHQKTAPGSTPYPLALRTAAILDGFKTSDANGVFGFFTYPKDEAAGQFTNIPTTVGLDVYVFGSSDGLTGSAVPGGTWAYTSSAVQYGPWRQIRKNQPKLSGTDSTDTFILNAQFGNARIAPELDFTGLGGDVAVIDRYPLGATSTTIDFVDRARFLGCGLSNTSSQFVYETSTGALYYDKNPQRPGYTSILGVFRGVTDPAEVLFVL